MTNEEIKKLKVLFDEVMHSYTKTDAKLPFRKLEFAAAQIKPQISPYGSEKLSQAVGYAKSASGQIENKEHWMRNAEQSWYLFEREVDSDEEE